MSGAFALPGPVLVVDVETTGIDPVEHDICQLGYVLLDPALNIMASGQEFVKPTGDARDLVAMSIHKIPEVVLATASGPFDVLARMEAACGCIGTDAAVLAGWSVHFDAAFLKAAYAKCSRPYPFRRSLFDVKSAAIFALSCMGSDPSWSSLQDAVGKAGLEFDGNAHAALDDAMNTVRLLKRIVSLGWQSRVLREGGY